MKFFKKSDIVIILSIIVICIFSWVTYNLIASDKPAKAEIYYKSELVKTILLNTGVDKTFSIPQNKNVIFHLYKDGSIRFEESDCPDKICIKTGKLNIVGESAACLPNEIILKIVPQNGYKDDDIDIIIG
jgi:hypothetical protein